MQDEDRVQFISWIILNIFLPLLPLVVKALICLFSLPDKITSITIFEDVELLFYDLFTCVILLNMLSSKKAIGLSYYLMKKFFYIIQVVVLILIILNYLNLANGLSLKVAKGLAVFCPIVAGYTKYKFTLKEGSSNG